MRIVVLIAIVLSSSLLRSQESESHQKNGKNAKNVKYMNTVLHISLF
jgi:hypothetical protein